MPKVSILLVLTAFTFDAQSRAAESLCASTEQTYFNCSVVGSGKVASVCGAGNISANRGYLQYRFGHPGKVEFEYPKERSGSTKLFWWDGRDHRDVADDWFWFRSGGFVYSVFFIEDHDTPDRKFVFRSGVMAEKKGDDKAAKSLDCAKPATGNFKQLIDIVSSKEIED